MTRTDVHRPSAINPDDYEFVACEYMRLDDLGSASFILSERARIRAHMERTGGAYSRHQHGGNCHICGASAIYTALFYHAPTNSYIRTGEDCADKLDSGALELFRRKCHTALEQVAGKRKAEALLAKNGLATAWRVYVDTPRPVEQREEGIVIDIVAKLVQYGSLSDAQFSFLRKLTDAIVRRPEIAAQRAAEAAAAQPLPVIGERIEVVGAVVSIRRGDYGFPDKMLVKHNDGWKLWGTVPAALAGVKPGDRIAFCAKIKPSKNDPKFGFASRPTKARIMETAA